jgi:hypothetical protein
VKVFLHTDAFVAAPQIAVKHSATLFVADSSFRSITAFVILVRSPLTLLQVSASPSPVFGVIELLTVIGLPPSIHQIATQLINSTINMRLRRVESTNDDADIGR